MNAPAAQPNESDRLDALAALDVLDTPAEDGFDAIVRLIRTIFDVKIATVTLVDAHRQWFKAAIGVPVPEMPRRGSFCDVTVSQSAPLVIDDTTQDGHFATNSLVTGPPHVRAYAGIPLTTSGGHAVGSLCAINDAPRHFSAKDIAILQDLARLTVAQLEARRDARTDHLTGMLGRRGMREIAEQTFRLAQRHHHELAVIALDIDHFKAVNDTYGHAVGDAVLAEFARRINTLLRATDQVGRMGGEEFAILLPHTSSAGAMEVAEKIRQNICDTPFQIGTLPIAVTTSLGVAIAHSATTDLDRLFADADTALYRAKTGGRNRVVEHSAPAVSLQPKATKARRRVMKAGLIRIDGQTSTIDCTVRSLGAEGAGLDVIDADEVPNLFILEIPADGVELDCTIVMKTERHIEASFRPR